MIPIYQHRERHIGVGVDEIAKALEEDEAAVPIIASDGGAEGDDFDSRGGSWAVAHAKFSRTNETPDGSSKVAGRMPGLDQSAPACEAYAAAQACSAALQAKRWGFVVFINSGAEGN